MAETTETIDKPFVSSRSRGMDWLIIIFFLLLLFESAIRKWLLPGLEEYVYFLRAPVALCIYLLAWYKGLMPKPRWAYVTGCGFAVASLLVIVIQMIAGGYSLQHLLLAGYGWYLYFFYIPLAFIIADQFSSRDLDWIVIVLIVVSLVSAIIMFIQFNSPATALINTGPGAEISSARALNRLVRPGGLFTSSLANQQFTLLGLVFFLGMFFSSRSISRIQTIFVIIFGISISAMIALSQNRGLFLSISVVLAMTVIAVAVSAIKRNIWRLAGVFLFLVSLPLLWRFILPASFNAFLLRWTTASQIEEGIFPLGTFGRILYSLYGFILYIADTPLPGYLMGMSGNAAFILPWVDLPPAYYNWAGYGLWSEHAFENHIIELGPLLGLCFILFRVALAAWVGWVSLKASRRERDPLPLLLFAYTGVLLLLGHITSQGTVNGFFWFSLGINLAVCRKDFHFRRTCEVSGYLEGS